MQWCRFRSNWCCVIWVEVKGGVKDSGDGNMELSLCGTSSATSWKQSGSTLGTVSALEPNTLRQIGFSSTLELLLG